MYMYIYIYIYIYVYIENPYVFVKPLNFDLLKLGKRFLNSYYFRKCKNHILIFEKKN